MKAIYIGLVHVTVPEAKKKTIPEWLDLWDEREEAAKSEEAAMAAELGILEAAGTGAEPGGSPSDHSD